MRLAIENIERLCGTWMILEPANSENTEMASGLVISRSMPSTFQTVLKKGPLATRFEVGDVVLRPGVEEPPYRLDDDTEMWPEHKCYLAVEIVDDHQ
jgi:hypothetical protein